MPLTITDIGGIAVISSGVVRACLNHGTVGYLHIGYNIGGIVGSQTGYVEGCVNYGPVYAAKRAAASWARWSPAAHCFTPRTPCRSWAVSWRPCKRWSIAPAMTPARAGSSLSNQLNDLQSRITGARNAVDTLLDQTKNGVSLSTQTIKTDLSALINGNLSGSENNQGNQHWDLDVTIPTPTPTPTPLPDDNTPVETPTPEEPSQPDTPATPAPGIPAPDPGRPGAGSAR